MEIALSQNMVAIIDDEDYKLISKYKWYYNKGNGYAHANKQINYYRYTYTMHRMIMGNPEGMHVDHINGNKLDNRKCNLRVCTNQENRWNMASRRGSSKHKGVYWDKKRNHWRAEIKCIGEKFYLGGYITEDEAGLAYNIKAKELYGDFARLNEIPKGVVLKSLFSSKYKGVSFNKERNKWESYIGTGKNRIRLGKYNTEEDAYYIREEKLKELNIF